MSTSIYDDMMNELFSGREPNDYHETIVNTDYKYILTTNYDTLLDKAAMRQKHYDLVRRIYSYKDLQKISEAVYTGEPAIIHVHGIATEVVLRSHSLQQEALLCRRQAVFLLIAPEAALDLVCHGGHLLLWLYPTRAG